MRSMHVDQYVAGLPRKRRAAGVLFRDRLNLVLLVAPTYEDNWEVPGGVVEADEAPWEAARREQREEIAWDRSVGRLLVVGYVRPQDKRPEGCSSSRAACSPTTMWPHWCSTLVRCVVSWRRNGLHSTAFRDSA
jgi:ADP-ribose pyrophosphatase YjhB (NUDIX family)